MRSNCITQKIRTEFGSMYIHIDLDADGRPVGGQVSTPGKEPESQITRLIATISEGLDAACKVASDAYDAATDARLGYFKAQRLIREQGLRDGKFKPMNEHERVIAEGRDK